LIFFFRVLPERKTDDDLRVKYFYKNKYTCPSFPSKYVIEREYITDAFILQSIDRTDHRVLVSFVYLSPVKPK